MSGAWAFLRKEFREILGTYKIYVIPSAFLLMGLLSPLVAKFTPEIVKSMAAQMQGFSITLPPPTAVDAYAQLLKNYNQINLFVLIFSTIGLVAEEKVRGTAALLLAKPVPRWSFIVDKYLASAILVAAATLLSYLACLYYTVILFHHGLLARSVPAVGLVFIHYLFLLALVVFASTISPSTAVAGVISVGGLFLLSLLASLGGWLGKYTPGSLAGWENKLLTGRAILGDAWLALGVTMGLTLLLLGAAVAVFGRQEL